MTFSQNVSSASLAALLMMSAITIGELNNASRASATFPGMMGKIVFTSFRDGNAEIYVMNADGTGQTNLSNNSAWDSDPKWSADGKKIVFTSLRDGNYEIYVMNADGTGQTRITNNTSRDSAPNLSPDGSKIVFYSNRDGNDEIYVMNADGTGQTNLTNNPARDYQPDLSPDGKKIVFTTNRDGGESEIYAMNIDGTNATRLTNNTPEDAGPFWSADGTKIAFVTDRDGHDQIYTMNADGSGQVNRSNNSFWEVDPNYSPDNMKIAFVSNRDGNNEIYVMNADGSGQTRLTDTAGDEFQPNWQSAVTGQKHTLTVKSIASDQFSTINIRAYIDGRSQLILKGNTAQWHHLDFAAPGRHLFANLPTVINDAEWFPDWPDVPDKENRDCNCNSSTYQNLTSLSLPAQSDVTVALKIVEARSSLTIVQQPSASNGYTTIVEFDDNTPSGAAWYEAQMTFTKNTPLSGMWTTIRSTNGTFLQSGFTPLTFTGTVGTDYKVTVANYFGKTFLHWQDDGSTSNSRIVNLTSDTSLTAAYVTGKIGFTPLNISGRGPIIVNAVSIEEGRTLHMWTIAFPTRFEAISVKVHDYQNLVFDHWEDGSKDRIRSVADAPPKTLTAYYRTG